MDIITREEWGADESWKYTRSHVPSPLTPASVVTQSIISYMISHHPDEVKLDAVVRTDGGEELYRPYEYKRNKKAIVVHHTVSSQERIDEQGGVIPHLQQIYNFHTFSRGWGDIGYNFLIDKEGNIYEGRAGGVDVVGAHAIWNNNQSVGVSLIGNFEEEEPSVEMLASLTRLSTALALYYDINPLDEILVHKKIASAPYLVDVTTTGIAGHQDVGNTSCPGSHVYAYLPTLREDVAVAFLSTKGNMTVSRLHQHLDPVLIEGKRDSLILRYESDDVSLQGEVTCERKDPGMPLTVRGCRLEGDELILDVDVTGSYRVGSYPLWVSDGSARELWYISTVWSAALDDLLADRRHDYIAGSVSQVSARTKHPDTLRTSREATDSLSGDVRVLLYEPSMNPQAYQYVSCQSICMIDMTTNEGSMSGSASTVSVVYTGGQLLVTSDTDVWSGSSLVISDKNGGYVSLDSYERTSYAGTPWNRFLGSLKRSMDGVRSLADNAREDRVAVINTLSVRDYLYGIGEAAIAEHPEKHKTIALLAKQYLVYYLNSDAHQPSLTHPDGRTLSYDAIDDPRSFQKYVGVGRLDVMPERRDIVDSILHTWVTVDDHVVLLPYFNCSPGFTRSGQEVRGWTNTPHLVSVLDFLPASCKNFHGHGVGLSGRGAQYMAEAGIRYQHILEYYYRGITIEESL